MKVERMWLAFLVSWMPLQQRERLNGVDKRKYRAGR